jgi:hypothetical protein
LNVIAINNDSERVNRFVEIVAPTTIKNSLTVLGGIVGNLFSNLIGGENITLTESNGITTINSSGGGGLSESTLYAFCVTSNFNSNRSYNNAVLEFNSISYDGYFVKPDTTAYNFNTFQYTVPINGVWSIGCRIYIQEVSTANLRLG